MNHKVQEADSRGNEICGHRQYIKADTDGNHPPHLRCWLKFKAEAQDASQDDDKTRQIEKHPKESDGDDADPFNERQADKYRYQDYFGRKPDQP